MDREPFNHPATPFVAQRFSFASTSERDEWAKTFPSIHPAGHTLKYRWVDDKTVELALLPDVPPKPETVKAVAEIAEASEGDLRAKAAEMGIALPKKATRQQIAALIQEKESQ